MTPRKKTASSSDEAHPAHTQLQAAAPGPAPSSRLARIPSPVRFMLVVLDSLILSSVLFTLTASLTLSDLGHVSKHLKEWWEVAGLMAWRAVEVGLSWVFGFDGFDVASFFYLTHLPTYSLLSFFYGVRPTSVLLSSAITVISTVIPFIFLRCPTSVNEVSKAPSEEVDNDSILQDRVTTVYTTLLASSIFSVVLYASYATWLPVHLVVHFESIADITAAHAGPAGFPRLFLTLIPAGCAARQFLFVSSTGASTGAAASPAESEGEYLIVGLYRKTWGKLSVKTQVLASRTLVLATGVLLNTIVQVAGTIQSVSVEGAAAWGAVWATATLVVGTTFGWIEAVDGV